MKVVIKSMALLLVINLASCRAELRGEVQKSPDGKTYLVFEGTAGCDCDSLYVNGEIWPYGLDKGAVPPGTCLIGCGPDRIDYMGIIIEKGTTFHFDYWGP